VKSAKRKAQSAKRKAKAQFIKPLLRSVSFYVLLTPPLFHPNFWVAFPLHLIAHVGVSKRMGLKLFGREIIFEEFQSTVCDHAT